MQITLENIGQIKKAEIDLNKDLIVLCGANNTGKTYLAYSIYGLYNSIEPFGVENSIKGVKKILNTIFEVGSLDINILDIFLTEKKDILGLLSKKYIDYLPTVFASAKDFFRESQINIDIDNKSIEKYIIEGEEKNIIGFGSSIVIQLQKEKNSKILNVTLIKENTDSKFPSEIILEIINEKILGLILGFFFNKVHIEPAERLATNIFSKELSEKRQRILEDISQMDKVRGKYEFIENIIKTSRYSLPIKDNLIFTERLDIYQKEKSPLSYLADEIEKNILMGKMKLTKTGDVQFNPSKSKLNLGIHLTASIVKSLASLVFYCRHLAKPNDFIIIDEPELNLHPDNQRKVARVIAQMVNAGIKVMISTHSDYIIRELNNLMMLNVENNEREVNKILKKYGYKENQKLDYTKVGAYLFTTNEVKPMEVTNTGFEVESIDNEINLLNESSREIFFTLHENE